jgi:hypothetical protein
MQAMSIITMVKAPMIMRMNTMIVTMTTGMTTTPSTTTRTARSAIMSSMRGPSPDL